MKQTFTLATQFFCAKMARKNGTGCFISTRCVDAEGRVHGIAIPTVVWDALSMGGWGPFDRITVEGELRVPEPGSEGETLGTIVRKDGSSYVRGEVVRPLFTEATKGAIHAPFVPSKEMPVYNRRPEQAVEI